MDKKEIGMLTGTERQIPRCLECRTEKVVSETEKQIPCLYRGHNRRVLTGTEGQITASVEDIRKSTVKDRRTDSSSACVL